MSSPSDASHAGGEAPVWEVEVAVLEPHYGVDAVPPPLETLLYALQHTLVDISPYVLPLVVAGAVGYSDVAAASMISACLVTMGFFTFVNATWGHRLPSIMGPSATDTGAMATAGQIFGALPLTTYSQNTGVLATTRVAGRRVVQVAAGLLLLYGLSPKVGALLVLIPRPIVGVVFLVVCGMIATAALRLLATSITLITALTLPLAAPVQGEWFATLPPAARLFLSNSVVLAVTLGVSLNALLGAVLRGGGRDGSPSAPVPGRESPVPARGESVDQP